MCVDTFTRENCKKISFSIVLQNKLEKKVTFRPPTFIEMLKEGERKEEDPMLFYANPHLHDYAGHVDMNGGP